MFSAIIIHLTFVFTSFLLSGLVYTYIDNVYMGIKNKFSAGKVSAIFVIWFACGVYLWG